MGAPLLCRLRPALLAAASILLLAGCVKLDVDLTVSSDDKARGTYIVAVDKSVLAATGQDADSLVRQLTAGLDQLSLPAGADATAERYDEGDFVGAKVTITDFPIDKLNSISGAAASATGSNAFTITRDGDVYHFTARLDLAVTGGATNVSVPDELTKTAQLHVKMTFPGEVTETNGTKDGRSVTWEPTFGDVSELTATATATGSGSTGGSGGGGSAMVWLVVIAVAGALAVVGAAVALLLSHRREIAHGAAQTGPLQASAPPPPLSSLAPPRTRALPPAPLPPPSSSLPPPSLPPPSPPAS